MIFRICGGNCKLNWCSKLVHFIDSRNWAIAKESIIQQNADFLKVQELRSPALPLRNARSNDNPPVITVPLKSVSLLEAASYAANVLRPSGLRA